MAILSFQIDYHTAWGEQVCLCESIPELGEMDESKALPLTNEGNLWFAEVTIPQSRELRYYYFIRERENTVRREWGTPRTLRVTASKDYVVRDLWKNRPYHAYLYSSAFTDTFFAHTKEGLPERYHAQSVLLNVVCPYVSSEQTLVVSGDCELGQWNLRRAKPMRCLEDGVWQLLLNAKKLPKRSSYKFVIVDKATRGPTGRMEATACWSPSPSRPPGFSRMGLLFITTVFSLGWDGHPPFAKDTTQLRDRDFMTCARWSTGGGDRSAADSTAPGE